MAVYNGEGRGIHLLTMYFKAECRDVYLANPTFSKVVASSKSTLNRPFVFPSLPYVHVPCQQYSLKFSSININFTMGEGVNGLAVRSSQ
jgi:hypothetical protein